MNEQLVRVVEQATGVPYHAVQLVLRPPLEIQSNELYDLWVGGRHLMVKRFLKADEMAVAPLREVRALHLLAP